MKAIVFAEYGSADNLHLKEVPQPTPNDNEVLLKVHAVALNAADKYAIHGKPFFMRFMFGLFKPTRQIILGADVAGRVEAVGKHVTQFKVGDEVFGDISGVGLGGLAEYVCVPESVLASKPVNLSFAEAATVPMAAVTALQGLRAGKIQAGQKVMVYGASGGVGSFAVQIAKALDAEVTAVCSPAKIEWARSLGADHVLDYTREALTPHGFRYDVILVANGNRSLADFEPALAPTGTVVVAGGSVSQLFKTMFLAPFKSQKGGRTFRALSAQPNQADLNTVKGWLESGAVKSLVDRQYPLPETPEAMRYLEAGHARGKVVITVE